MSNLSHILYLCYFFFRFKIFIAIPFTIRRLKNCLSKFLGITITLKDYSSVGTRNRITTRSDGSCNSNILSRILIRNVRRKFLEQPSVQLLTIRWLIATWESFSYGCIRVGVSCRSAYLDAFLSDFSNHRVESVPRYFRQR